MKKVALKIIGISLIMFSLTVHARGMGDLSREAAKKVNQELIAEIEASMRGRYCQSHAQKAVHKATQKIDENSSAIFAKYAGAFGQATGYNGDSPGLDLYYVTTSDESGACVWAAVVSRDNCYVSSVKDIYCF